MFVILYHGLKPPLYIRPVRSHKAFPFTNDVSGAKAWLSKAAAQRWMDRQNNPEWPSHCQIIEVET